MKIKDSKWLDKGSVLGFGLIAIMGVGEVASYEKNQHQVDWEYLITKSYRGDTQRTSLSSNPISYTDVNTITLASGVGHPRQLDHEERVLPGSRYEYPAYESETYLHKYNPARSVSTAPLPKGEQIIKIDPADPEKVDVIVTGIESSGKKLG